MARWGADRASRVMWCFFGFLELSKGGFSLLGLADGLSSYLFAGGASTEVGGLWWGAAALRDNSIGGRKSGGIRWRLFSVSVPPDPRMAWHGIAHSLPVCVVLDFLSYIIFSYPSWNDE